MSLNTKIWDILLGIRDEKISMSEAHGMIVAIIDAHEAATRHLIDVMTRTHAKEMKAQQNAAHGLITAMDVIRDYSNDVFSGEVAKNAINEYKEATK
jgi:predicted translin family RNA/ssDNA-binding protein